mmetsp:Transcript_25784/g.53427  ORF Transcript_25784/g.53427 Transcript_25784/m.53427 type:complete len:476 (-) Transcript_25784:87-1514(-)
MRSILEAFAKNDATTTVKIIATCLILGIAWLWWDCIKLRNPRDQITGENSVKNNSCNDPNCIRCHSKSNRHRETLERNVILLRRLMKMEPEIFEGMREEIVRVAEETVAKMHVGIDHRGSANEEVLNLSNSLKKITHFLGLDNDTLEGNKKYFQPIEIDDGQGMSCSEEMTSSLPLSPQPGQDPTVFFLPGLEAVPLHKQTTIHHMKQPETQSKNDGANSKYQFYRGCPRNCPCNRLWKFSPIAETNSPPIRLTGDIEALHQNFHIIRKELQQLVSYKDHFVPFDTQVYSNVTESSHTSSHFDTKMKKPSWSSIYLYHQGLRRSETCNKYFPQTTLLIESKCPHRMAGKCGLGSVYFSKLDPNIKVMEHCGPTNVRWRCHIPLVVPNAKRFHKRGWESRSHLRVGRPDVNEQIVEWEEGVPILFDDSFLHSALHVRTTADKGADESRIVLIIDFWHPSLSEADRTALGVLYPPGL